MTKQQIENKVEKVPVFDKIVAGAAIFALVGIFYAYLMEHINAVYPTRYFIAAGATAFIMYAAFGWILRKGE